MPMGERRRNEPVLGQILHTEVIMFDIEKALFVTIVLALVTIAISAVFIAYQGPPVIHVEVRPDTARIDRMWKALNMDEIHGLTEGLQNDPGKISRKKKAP